MIGSKAISLLFASAFISAIPGCTVAPQMAAKPNTEISYNGKTLVLVRPATQDELKNIPWKFAIDAGGKIWYYETRIDEFMASERGYCHILNGKILSRYVVSGS